VELLKAIANRPQVNDAFLHIPYSEQGQWEFGVDVITHFGFDWNRGRQDKSVHPFTTSFGVDDVRITTRFDKTRAASALFSTMHEGGHALYEQGISPSLRRYPLATAPPWRSTNRNHACGKTWSDVPELSGSSSIPS
jgi:carboxypeptidase Taq